MRSAKIKINLILHCYIGKINKIVDYFSNNYQQLVYQNDFKYI